MKSFLSIVAGDLLKKYGSNLSNITIVFPNKRASLFLNEELIKQSGGRPVWSPQYMTISDLFRSASELIVADQIKLVCELYRHYSSITGTTETLDEFYGWGEMMLADFDDLDKNMGDSQLIFENTSELHEYDSVTFLTDEQKAALKKFFSNFKDDQSSVLRQNFKQLWDKLKDIYDTFRESLYNQGIAYEGMLYRDVIENNLLAHDEGKLYAFVGFNLLQKVEQQLFENLAREGKAVFYWDYDTYYMKEDNEAGKYIRELMRVFPNEITEDTHPDAFNNMRKKDITYMSASSEDIQARYVSQWLTNERIDAGKRTAIVLCDEKLLPTVIHSLPETVKNVNITTGYPLSQTLVATFVKQFFTLKMSGHSGRKSALRLHQVNNVLRHPYMKYILHDVVEVMTRLNDNHIFYPTIDDISSDEVVRQFFSPLSSGEQKDTRSRNMTLLHQLLSALKMIAKQSRRSFGEEENELNHELQLMQESIYRMHQIITRISTMIEEGELNVDTITMQGLINQIIRSTTVPFHGEPIIGIQIMGVLETRNLDFDNMLILSANEGNMPKGVNDASFIPHTIRRSYNLTTVENKVAIYAYYFHRMIQRASNVTLTYNNTSSDARTCEMSRFMMQLLAESNTKIDVERISNEISVCKTTRMPISKTPEVIRKMTEKGKISPSAINNYLNCQLIYFYKNVCDIKDNSDGDEEEMDNRTFGLIFHRAAEILYKPYEGKIIRKEDIEAMLKDPSVINRAIEQGFKDELFKMKSKELRERKMPQLDGTQLINYGIIRRLITSLLNYDKKQCPFKIIKLEHYVEDTIELNTDYGTSHLMVNGIIDRLDEVRDVKGDAVIRVVDYKTGSKVASANDIDAVFSTERADRHKHNDYYLQTLLYCNMLSSPETPHEDTLNIGNTPIVPALLYPHKALQDGYNPILKFSKDMINDSREYTAEYKEKFYKLLSEIFDRSIPFKPTDDINKCAQCFYSAICGKYK
ncbi:MAG: PD-(D/E)XK nuclease family protein [Prevotella sp.]|nr:PD-(D/E)XK nuclease family protein [Prevotella sp.]